MPARSAPLVIIATLLIGGASLVGCTPGDDQGTGSTTTTEPPTTTTALPVLLALSPNLDLVVEQCFAEIPVPSTTIPEPAAPEGGEAAVDDSDRPVTPTEPTVPDTLPETTTIPRPPTIAVVDCAGSNLGQVYATFCLGADEGRDRQLTAVACPGDDDLEYPGDRTLRRAAARICLQRFEERFGERYATSQRVAQEFLPTEGVWNRGDRRVVCHSYDPPPTTTTSPGRS